MKANVKVVKSSGTTGLLTKAMESNKLDSTSENNQARADGIISRPYPIGELQKLVEHSTILQQCIEAYKRNIVGFGATPNYTTDDTVLEETPEMIAEWNKVKEIIKVFNFDKSFEEVFAEVLEDREVTGNGFLEIIRDGLGLPAGGERIDPINFYTTKLSEPVEVEYKTENATYTRRRQFRKYVQDLGTSKVFFKEFGDPRKMDKRNGEYVEAIEEVNEANEIIHFKIGSGIYGIPRWIGQLIHMYGARKAEELNYRYFTQGRHTPMAILLHNATLSPESENALTQYAQSVEGSENSHKFLIIEAEGLEEGILEDEKKNAKVEVKSLADMLQNDALFLEYDEASREKVQSSFRLPDLYVGRSKDFNRATADTARAVTEEQVFEPERNSLEWIINNKILVEYELKLTNLAFKKPEISNPEELARVLEVFNQIGAVAPNDVRDVLGKFLGKELENFEGEEFDRPLIAPTQQEDQNLPNENNSNSFAKSDDRVLNVLKEVRDYLEDIHYGESRKTT